MHGCTGTSPGQNLWWYISPAFLWHEHHLLIHKPYWPVSQFTRRWKLLFALDQKVTWSTKQFWLGVLLFVTLVSILMFTDRTWTHIWMCMLSFMSFLITILLALIRVARTLCVPPTTPNNWSLHLPSCRIQRLAFYYNHPGNCLSHVPGVEVISAEIINTGIKNGTHSHWFESCAFHRNSKHWSDQ